MASAIVLSLGVSVYAGFQLGHDDDRTLGVTTQPVPSPIEPAGYPSVPVSVAPAPASPSASSAVRLSPPPASSARLSPSPGSPPTSPSTAPTTRRPALPAWTERTITSTSVLTSGQSWSTNRLALTVTPGGDLVLRDQGRPVWRTNTTTGVKLVMQNDGHLVLYDAANSTVWSSGTAGNPGALLLLRANGSMAITANGRTLFQVGPI
ncbi:hypothetical protein ACGFJ7_31020 [Actinoplanes sp. NPDC048988]|uniref:hypothetical protein n=1 Tax=Actinoplanes sp. NPDC048988 TaxID=3363901 RepID=UPI0037179957